MTDARDLPPPLAALADDPARSGAAVRVYLHLWPRLTDTPRPVKRLAVAHALDVDPLTVTRALRELVAAGYLVRGPDDVRGVGTYARPVQRPGAKVA